MNDADLEVHYRRYLDCLNDRRIDELDEFVHEDLVYNGEPETRADYRDRIAESIAAIPDLRYEARLIVVQGDRVACRLLFECTPQSEWLGLQPTGASISFSEHIFYGFREGRIHEAWSLVDVPAIEAQLAP